MSGSGTDKTKSGVDLAGPVVVLVEPQLGENIGMAARAMGNFGLTRLRIVNPRDGWPNVHARRAASGADHILDQVELFDTVEQAVADCTLLFATTARAHDQAKPVVAPEVAAREIAAEIAGGGTVGILFGRERSEPASQHQMQAFFDNLVRELDKVEFLRPKEKRETMLVNLRNIFTRMEPTKQDMHTLHGVVMAIAEGRKGPAKGGVLDGEQATRLRALLAEHGQGAMPSESGTVRGLARLLRRNPTDAERMLWRALTTDRRFAGQFKRQTPVGRHIPDFVSFVHRVAIELINRDETETIAIDRAARQSWLEARGYRVVDMRVGDVAGDLAKELDRLESALHERG